MLTPILSEAETETAAELLKVEPDVGDVILTVGALESLTVTVNDAVAILPAASLAVHVTVVVPRGNIEPESGVHVGPVAKFMLSVAVTVKVTFVPEELAASTTMLAGLTITGFVLSIVMLI